ncbi:MAG TPA: hypothetical protein VK974_03170 [Methylophilaceae bacterium]|nr:hypothetical protein [Methylophilaceae bacterium]
MIKIKGKYLKAIEDFIEIFVLKEWWKVLALPQYQNLVSTIYSLQKKYLYEINTQKMIETEIYKFVAEQIDKNEKIPDINQGLKSELKNRLITTFESYPREYLVRFEMPKFPDWGEFDIKITDKIKIVSGKHDFDPYNIENLPKASRLVQALRGYPGTVYLQIDVKGYGDEQANSPAIASAISIAKQCAFVMTTFGIMQKEYYSPSKARATLEAKKQKYVIPVELPGSMRDCYLIKPIEIDLKIYDKDSEFTLLGDPGRAPNTNQEKIDAFTTKLYPLTNYFLHSKHPDFLSISAAIEWYQDSKYSDNQTFSYLAACIGLEALLGTDEYMDQMSKRLTDRFATLMGKGKTQRNNMAKEYIKVLQLRGEIVHAKQARLTPKHQETLTTVQQMLLDVIWRELHQMYKQSKNW